MSNTVFEAIRRTNLTTTLVVPNTSSQDKLQQALTNFRQLLTPEEVLALSNTGTPSASSVTELVSKIDKQKSRLGVRRLGKYFQPLLQSIQHFSGVVETLVSSNPQIAALVWGSVKFAILAALNFFGYFEKLAEMFRSLGRLCPVFKEFQEIFSESVKLRESLLEFYTIVVKFCTEALRFLKEKPIVQFGKSLWKSFQERFQDFEIQLREQKEEIDQQIRLASEKEAHRARQEISLYQHKADEHRSKQIKQWEDSRDWKVRKDTRDKEIKRTLLLEKISDYNYMSTFSKARSQRYKNTGLWLFDSPEFKLWDQEEKSCGLWCNGIPGSGKTFLTAGVIDYLFSHRQGTTTSISYFFCEFANEQSREVGTILSSLIKQILTVFDRIPPEMEDGLDMIFFKNHHREPEVEELYQLLVSATQLSATAYLLLDGLDECTDSNRRQLSSYLNKLIRNSKSKVKILISSRPELDISHSLDGFHLISLKPSTIGPDIDLFVCGIVDEKLQDRSLVVKQPCMVEEIKHALIRGSDGMFLWVTFQIQDICRENNDEDIREVLRSLPRGLDATYSRILNRILKDRKPDVARKIFQWLAVARRVLSLDELVQAISVKPGCPQYNEESLPTDKHKTLQNCGNMVIHDEQHDTVQFAHYTVLEFLLLRSIPKFLVQKSEANLYVGKVCLTYLSFPDFETQISNLPKDPVSDASALDMPVSEWISSAEPNVCTELLLKFGARRLKTQNQSAATARRFFMPKGLQDAPLEPSEELGQKFYLLKYAANEWLFHCARISLDDEVNWKLFEDLVFHRTLPFTHLPKEFLGGGLGTDDLYYTSYLKWAVGNDNEALLRLIVNKLEAENIPATRYIETRIDTSQTLLQVASMRGDQSVLEILIGLGADVNALPAFGGDGWTALQAAAGGGHLAVVDRLLQSGANVNESPANSNGRTALQAAAGGGHLAVVDRLLQSGANVNASPAESNGRTPLQEAIYNRHKDVVDRLREAGAK